MSRLARFGLAGGVGFAVDFLVLALALRAGLGPLAGRALSFSAAVVATYLINSRYTFGAGGRIGPRGFGLYLAASLGGLAINLAVYGGLVLAGLPPLAALAVASLCALSFNYLSYARIFRSAPGSRRG